MSKQRCSSLLYFVSALLATAIGAAPALSQEKPAMDLYTVVQDDQIRALSDEQNTKLEAYRSDPTAAEITVIRLGVDVLKTLDAVNLNFPEAPSAALDIARVDQRSQQDYSWFGKSSQTDDEAILVVRGSSVVGTIRSGGRLYRVRPLDGGLSALILVDETKFPPDHPPELREIERRSQPAPRLRDARDVADACTTYRAIVGYTAAAKSQAGDIDGLIQLAIDETNQGYANSNVNTQIALAHKYQANDPESGDVFQDLTDFRTDGDNIMDEVHDLRDTYAADVALLITGNASYCGLASRILADEGTAFAVVLQSCATGYYSFAHEIGHLQGARHNPEADPTNTPFAYGHGYYYEPDGWRTKMSYGCPSGCTRLKYWSNPNVQYGGVPMGTAATHHNARVLNETACDVANFRTGTGTPLRMALTLDPDKRLGKGDQATARSEVTENGAPAAGKTVAFSTEDPGRASVAPAQVQTNAAGVAEATVEGETFWWGKTMVVAEVDGVEVRKRVRVPSLSTLAGLLVLAGIGLAGWARSPRLGRRRGGS